MMCVAYSITIRNNASNFGGGFRWQSEYPWCIIEIKINNFKKKREKQKKKRKNGKFYAIPVFNQIDFFIWLYNSKNNHCKYLKFSSNINVSYEFSNFYEIYRKRGVSLQQFLRLNKYSSNIYVMKELAKS
ncbi:Uncharacterized protein FWK35_00002826, partial [Aphis craccivora]